MAPNKTFSLASHTFGFVWQMDIERTLEAIAAAGFRAVQIMASAPHFDPWKSDPERTRRLRAVIARHGLEVLACDVSSADANLASPSADVRAFAIDTYTRLIDRCAELDARWVCVGSGRANAILDDANANLMPLFTSAFDTLVERAKARGVTVLLENQAQGMLPDAGSIASFLGRYAPGEVDLAYDVANAFAVKEEPVDGLRALRTHLSVVHLSDAPKGVWRHDPVGSGGIDFNAVHQTLSEIGFSGPIALEICGKSALEATRDSRTALELAGWHFS